MPTAPFMAARTLPAPVGTGFAPTLGFKPHQVLSASLRARDAAAPAASKSEAETAAPPRMYLAASAASFFIISAAFFSLAGKDAAALISAPISDEAEEEEAEVEVEESTRRRRSAPSPPVSIGASTIVSFVLPTPVLRRNSGIDAATQVNSRTHSVPTQVQPFPVIPACCARIKKGAASLEVASRTITRDTSPSIVFKARAMEVGSVGS